MVLALVCLASAAYMAGVAWLVQLVVYPAFALVGLQEWAAYHRAHTRAITWVVAPVMLVELVSSAALVVARPAGVGAGLVWAGLAIAVATWALTLFVAVPEHEQLGDGLDLAVVARLVRGHAARTLAWSAHAVVACLIVAAA